MKCLISNTWCKCLLPLCVALCVTMSFGKDNLLTTLVEADTTFTENVIIGQGEEWTIAPGVTIRINGYHRIVVRGLLIAEGAKNQPIRFTCPGRPRSVGDSPCWEGIEISGKQANAIFRHCSFHGAFRNLVWEARPVFDSCEFVGNHYAIYCAKGSAAHIKNCTMTRNSYGIMANNASPLVLDNVITDNSVGVNLQMSSGLIAGRNTISGNTIDIRSETSMGANDDALSIKYLWDLMRQLY